MAIDFSNGEIIILGVITVGTVLYFLLKGRVLR